jgi:DNA invertase Pin-like site-specific DNA recombinase
MTGLSIGNARVSTEEQDLTAQRDGLVALGVEPSRVYVDHGLTGTNRERPGPREALAACRAGDTLVVTKLDRLARSLPDARAIAKDPTKRKVRLSLGGSVYDPTDPVEWLLFNVLAMVAEFEADLIRSRTREGMQVAKAKGHLRGKQPKLNARQEAHLVELLQSGEYSTAELGDLFGVARSTVYRAVVRSKAAAAAGRTVTGKPGTARAVPPIAVDGGAPDTAPTGPDTAHPANCPPRTAGAPGLEHHARPARLKRDADRREHNRARGRPQDDIRNRFGQRDGTAAANLCMAEVALSLTLGPSTARLDMSAAASGRSKAMGARAPPAGMLTPPPLPRCVRIGTPLIRSRSTSRVRVRADTRSSWASAASRRRAPRAACSLSMSACWRSTRRSARWLSREAAARSAAACSTSTLLQKTTSECRLSLLT